MNDKDKSKSLQLMKQEFEEFKKRATLPAPVAERTVPARDGERGELLLHCATLIGRTSQMALKLSPGVAEIAAISKLPHRQALTTSSEEKTERGVFLKSHRLELGVFKECPHCNKPGLVVCDQCHSVSCLGPMIPRHRCPICRAVARVEFAGGGINIDIAASAAKAGNTGAPTKSLEKPSANFSLSGPQKKR